MNKLILLSLSLLFIASGCTAKAINKQTVEATKQNNRVQAKTTDVNSGPDLREDKNYPIDDIRAYSQYDRASNIDVLRKMVRPRSTQVDPNIWVYTEEFAKRFGMPSRWIGGEDFKGALALAYRQELTNDVRCGYFGSWDNCREMNQSYILDVYVPHNSKTIPWNTQKSYGVNRGGRTSRRWLIPYHFKNNEDNQLFGLIALEDKKDKLTKQSYRDLSDFLGYEKYDLGIDSVSTAHSFRSDGFGRSGDFSRVREFHRNALEGIDLITIEGLTSFSKAGYGEAQIKFYDMSTHEEKVLEYIKQFPKAGKNGSMVNPFHKDRYYEHKVYPGAEFMQRVKLYREANEEHDFFEYFKKNIKK